MNGATTRAIAARIVAIVAVATLTICAAAILPTLSRCNNAPVTNTDQERGLSKEVATGGDSDLPQVGVSDQSGAKKSDKNTSNGKKNNTQGNSSKPVAQESLPNTDNTNTHSDTQSGQTSGALRADWDLNEGYRYELVAYDWHFISDTCWQNPTYWSLKDKEFTYEGVSECYVKRSVKIIGKGYACFTYYSTQVRCSVISLLKDGQEVFARQKTLKQLSELVAPYKVGSLSVVGGGLALLTEEICKQHGLSCS